MKHVHMIFFYGKMPSYCKYLQAFGKIGIAKNRKRITSKLNDKGVICMMLGYATKNESGTYRLLNLLRTKVLKSINVKWLDMNYDQYVASKSTKTATSNNVEYNDFLEFDIGNSVKNQGVRDSGNTTAPTQFSIQTTMQKWKDNANMIDRPF